MFFRRSFARSREHSLNSSNDSQNSAAVGATTSYMNNNNSDYHHHHHHRDNNSDGNSVSSASPVRQQKQSPHDRYLKSVNVIQLTPLWEYIIRTRKLPDDVNVAEVFDEFLERLHDPEWQVRQHALRVLIDLLLVMGDEADVYFSPLIPPLIENLGHDAPAIRKASLDALRIYIANTIMPETVMLEVLDQGLERQQPTLMGARFTIGVILSIPSLIQPVLLTPKRSFIIRSVFNVLEKKMLQIQYQEIVLKVLLKIKEMIGEKEFNASLPVLMKRDFELLCKVYNIDSASLPETCPKLPKAGSKTEPKDTLKQGSTEKTWTYVVDQPTRDGGRREVSFNVVPDSDDSSDTNNNRTTPSPHSFSSSTFVKFDEKSPPAQKKSVNFDTHPVRYDYKIVENSDGQTDVVTTITDTKTKRSFSARSRPHATELVQQRPASHTSSSHGSNINDDTDASSIGKVIIETEIKLSKDAAVTMRIFETAMEENDSANVTEENVQFELDIDGLDEDAPKEVNINVIKASDNEPITDGENKIEDDDEQKTSRRVTFGGELIKMRTPDSDAVDNSDNNVEHSDNDTLSTTSLPVSNGFRLQPPERQHHSSASPKQTQPQSSSQSQSLSQPQPSTSRASDNFKTHATRQESSEYDSDRSMHTPLPTRTPNGFQKPLEIKIPDYLPQRPYTAGLRPSTSSPAIFTIPPTSSSDASDHHDQAFSPLIFSPRRHDYNRSKSATSQRGATIRRNSVNLVEKLSPKAREVQIIHNLARSPVHSPTPTPTPTSTDTYRIQSPQNSQQSTQSRQQSPQNQPKPSQSQQPEQLYRQKSPQTQQQMQPRQQVSQNQTQYNRSHLNEATQTSVQQTDTDNTDNSSPENRTHSWESLGIISANAIQNLKSGDHRLRSQGVLKLEEALKSFETLALIQPHLASLLKTLLSFENHPEILQQKQRIITNLISRLPLENLENNFGRIITGLCRQGGAGSNLVAKALMHRLPTATIVLRLLSEEFLHDRTSKFKENALQMVMFALITFPSTYFDVQRCVNRTAVLALDRKKRVRQAALDVLAILGQISSPHVVIELINEIVKYKMEGDTFVAAVRTRLSRKLLPVVSTDGSVKYALKLPVSKWQQAANSFGADIDWICAGSGSVSPPSSKERSNTSWTSQQGQNQHRTISFSTLDTLDGGPHPGVPSHQFGSLNPAYSRSVPDLNVAKDQVLRKTKLPVVSRFPVMNEPNYRQSAHLNPYATQLKKVQHQPRSIRPMDTESFVVELSSNSSEEPDPQPKLKNQPQPRMDQDKTKESTSTQQRQLKSILTTKSNNSDAISVISSTSNQQLSSHTPSGILKKSPQVDAGGDYDRAVGYDRPQPPHHDHFADVKSQDADSDDSTATRILEKSELAHHFEQKARAERPKSSYVSYPDSDTIVITRPKTVDGGGDLRLMLEIEPIDKITIRTPPKTPESRASTPKENRTSTPKGSNTTLLKSPDNKNSESSREQSQETVKPKSPSPAVTPSPSPLPTSTAIPLPPPSPRPSTASTINTIPLPPQLTAASPVPTVSESHPSNYTSPSPSPVPASDTFERTPTPEPQRRKSYVEEPIISRPDSNKPHVPHFNTPQSIQPLSNDSYESTTDTEHQQAQSTVPKRIPRAVPKKVKPVASQPSVSKKRDKHEEKVERPRDLLVNCFLKLQSTNWEEIMEGLESFQQLSNNHAELVDANLHLMTIELSKQIKNLRSQVARSACQVAGELFQTHRRTIESEAEELTAMLLNRTSDTNKFLRADAIRALESMCDNLPVAKVIHLLAFKGATHHNGLVKCATAKLLSRVVERIGGEKVFVLSKETRDKLILTTANLLMEGSLDTRSYAKEIFSNLAAAHPNCSKILIDVIPPRVYRNIEKTLKQLLA